MVICGRSIKPSALRHAFGVPVSHALQRKNLEKQFFDLSSRVRALD
jgi:hypothetical protein